MPSDIPVIRSPSAGWTPEQLALDELWQANVQATAARFRELRRCWNCFAPWNEAGECPTKGCRGPGSGFERAPAHPEKPCLGCGTPTSQRALGALTGASALERWAWCPRCELKRNLGQAQATAANPDVYPRVRERCAAFAAQLQAEVAA